MVHRHTRPKMMNKILQTLILTSLLMVGCNQSNSETELNPKKTESKIKPNQTDSSDIAILNNDSINYKIFKKGTSITLSQQDLIEIDRLLIECINEHNKKQEVIFKEKKSKYPDLPIKKKNFIIDLKNYQRQYVAVKNERGEKEVWVNCFCATFDNGWKTDIYIVSDGGNCFFDLKINLDAKKYYDFMVNGVA